MDFNAVSNEKIQSFLFISGGGLSLIRLPPANMQLSAFLSTFLGEDGESSGVGLHCIELLQD